MPRACGNPATADALESRPFGLEEEIAREKQARRDQFDALFAKWLSNRAEYIQPDCELTCADENSHFEREEELARLITTMPAVYPWMIFRKFEVLEHQMVRADSRELVLLAGIKADLLRFEMGEPT